MNRRKESASMCSKRLVVAAAMASVSACASQSTAGPQGGAPADIYQRSSVRLARLPGEAAACIVEHARASGHSAELVPLYGMEQVAVTVKTAVAGDMLAVLSLSRADSGSVAATTTWQGEARDRQSFVRELVQGC